MRKRNKKAKITALILGFILMGIGYAYLTANLKIKGTANISNAKWDVHFENAKVEEKSDTVTFSSNSNSNLAQGIPVIKGDNNTELEWEAVLNQPGDYYVISAEIVNAGDYDAEIDLDNSYVTYQFGENEEKVQLTEYDLRRSNTGLFGWRFVPNGEYIAAKNSIGIILYTYLDEDISNETWESIKGKTFKIKLELNYKQNASSNLSSGHPRIRFDNAVANGYSDTLTFPTNSIVPTITNQIKRDTYENYTEHTIEQSLIFNQPGDYYEFTLDLICEEDAYFTSFDEEYTMTIDNSTPIDIYDLNNMPEYFNYQVTTDGSVNSRSYDWLNRIDTDVINVRIELKNDITPEQLALIQGKVVNLKYFLKYHEYHGTL